MSSTAFRQPIKTISRQRKDLILSESFDLLKKKILIFTQCNNLNSKQLDELRTSLSKSNIQMKFLKTSVFRRALQESKYPELLEALSGPIIAWSSDQEPGEAGKALISAVKGKPNIHFLAGKIEEKIWTHEGCTEVLQNLKTKNEIQSQLLGLLQAPAANIHGILSQVPNTLAGIIDLQSKVSKESVASSEFIKVYPGKREILDTFHVRHDRQEKMEGILNFNEPLNVELLDKVVNTFYQGYGQEVQMNKWINSMQKNAQNLLNQFQENPNAWQLVDTILENSQNFNTKYIALQILEKLVQTRWNSLPREQCEGIKNYIVSLVIKTSANEISSKPEKIFLNKLNLLLVQILKHEWPKHWPNFISEIVNASRSSLTLCENNMIILKLLSEEAFDFSAEQMTTVKAKNLKTQLSGEFSEIFKLCIEILEYATRPSLIIATLEALLRFLKWIPLGYVFQTNLLETLCSRFLKDVKYRAVCISCLTEISGLEADQENTPKIVQMLQGVVDVLNGYYPFSQNLDFVTIYQDERNDNPRFIQNSALFLTTCLGKHLKSLELQGSPDVILVAHGYLLRISAVDDREVFKICLEYWNKFVDNLYREVSGGSSAVSGLFLNSFNRGNERKNIYSSILSSLRSVMIDKMVKPEEVLIVEDENGDIVREHVKESDVLAIYSVMRETLVFLTHLDSEDTKRIMLGRLSEQFSTNGWNRNELNRICWSVGSISGSMNEEMEKSFVIQVIRDLLSLCEMKKGKDNKAVVASNIMYVVGQYPRFLRQHWKFLKTVVNKLFEFMHEYHEGVQDMACETFVTIAKTCHRQFVTFQSGENELFVDEIIRRMGSIINDLSMQQVHFFYEAMGHLIQSQTDLTAQNDEIGRIMNGPNESWDQVIASISANPSHLNNTDTLKGISNILKTNLSICESLGSPYMAQLSRIYMDMLSLYRLSSKSIGEIIKVQGDIATRTPMVRGLRTVKKDILRLVEAYVQKCDNGPVFVENFVPVLFDAILSDYNQNIEQARDAEVLSLTATIISRFSTLMTDKVAPILDAVFECTLNMINKDFVEFPEHRANFFKLISSINVNCFDALLRLNRIHFKLIVDSCVWAFKHAHREIAETGLKICYDLLKNISASSNAAPAFYQAFYLSLFTDIFYVLTDGEHKSGFRYQSIILAHLFEIVESGLLQVPLYPPPESSTNFSDNRAFIKDFLSNMLRTSFPHLQQAQIDNFIRGLFDLNRDPITFKAHLRDFLISLKEFVENDQDLYAEEIELEKERKRRADKEAASKIPGMLKPLEVEEDSD